MYKTVCLAIALMLANTGKAQTTGQDEMLNEILSIKQSLDELRADVAKLREEIKAGPADDGIDFVSADGFAAKGPNMKKLRDIQFPQNQTEEALREYINEILLASRDQNSLSSNDPQNGMLCKVGPEHLDLLVGSLDASQFGMGEMYLINAIGRLANTEHKNMILEELPLHHELIGTVLQHGWESDAKDILLDELESNSPCLSPDWIRAVVELNDPTTYPVLASYFINGDGHASTFEVIRDLPITDLPSCVDQAWEKSKHQDKWETQSMAPFAAEYGHLDALDELFNILADNTSDDNRYYRPEVRSALLRLLDFRGSNDELVQWYNANKDRLVFDPARNKYVVQ